MGKWYCDSGGAASSDMDAVTTELTALAIIIIGSVGTLIKVLVDKLTIELRQNTAITTQARDASNGQLSSVLVQLAAERNLVQGLRAVVRDRDDKLAFLSTRITQVDVLLQEYSDRRTTRTTDADVIAAENHLLSE